ncbi:hypothetical protein QTI51_37915 [Variovorax sp. J22G73]|uniref:hypothetical protein n=1 Tax=unclassified Variovorax TaxID=663243 RepID=UPI0025783AA3|nr:MULTISPECIES: hypothetical protein [unclassified Variovorax]MDM0010571.1 hypothetical protein [Variovorax sp. J22R203]MDM0103100.1 hypothetical protein [Variovorax sp. J22G73]
MNTTAYPPRSGRETLAPSSSDFPRPRWHRVSWGAVVAGVIVAMAIQLVLSLLGAGLGLSTVDPLRYSSPDASTFGIAAGLWWVVSNALSLFAGGWVAAHLAGAPDKTDASLHGLLTWGLATVVTAYLVTSLIGSVMSGGSKVLGTAAAAGASSDAVTGAVRREMPSELSVDSIKNQAQQRLAQAAGAGGVDPTQPATAEQKQQAEMKARQVADQAAKRGSQAALALLLALVVGAIAATFGGSIAGRRYWTDDALR